LTAMSGSREYGRLSVALQVYAEAEIVMKVPRSAFYPSPKVDSALLTIKPKNDTLQIKDASLFEDLVRSLFTQRRRRLNTVLRRYFMDRYQPGLSSLLSQIETPEKRVFQTTPTELVKLANEISCILQGVG